MDHERHSHSAAEDESLDSSSSASPSSLVASPAVSSPAVSSPVASFPASSSAVSSSAVACSQLPDLQTSGGVVKVHSRMTKKKTSSIIPNLPKHLIRTQGRHTFANMPQEILDEIFLPLEVSDLNALVQVDYATCARLTPLLWAHAVQDNSYERNWAYLETLARAVDKVQIESIRVLVTKYKPKDSYCDPNFYCTYAWQYCTWVRPLYIAAGFPGDSGLEMAKMLLDSEMDPDDPPCIEHNTEDFVGHNVEPWDSPLRAAIRSGSSKVAQLLISHRASLNAMVFLPTYNHDCVISAETHLLHATRHQAYETMQTLLEADVDPDEPSGFIQQVLINFCISEEPDDDHVICSIEDKILLDMLVLSGKGIYEYYELPWEKTDNLYYSTWKNYPRTHEPTLTPGLRNVVPLDVAISRGDITAVEILAPHTVIKPYMLALAATFRQRYIVELLFSQILENWDRCRTYNDDYDAQLWHSDESGVEGLSHFLRIHWVFEHYL